MNQQAVDEIAVRLHTLMAFELRPDGSKIKRRARRLTGTDLADAVGPSQTTVNAWENAKRAPRGDEIYNLCSRFHISANWLLGLPLDTPVEPEKGESPRQLPQAPPPPKKNEEGRHSEEARGPRRVMG